MGLFAQVIASVLLGLAVVFVALGVILVRNTTPGGVRSLGLGMFGVALWVAGAGAEVMAVGSPEMSVLTRAIKWTGVSLVPPLFFLFVSRSALGRGYPRWLVTSLFVVPVLSILVVWTNPLHGWMYPPHGSWQGLEGHHPDWGPWFVFVHLPVMYLLMLAAWGLLASEVIRGSTLQRARAVVLFLGSSVPLVANVLYVTNPRMPDVQATPLAFAFTALVFGWGVFRLRLFQLNPLALRAVFDTVTDGVVLVDSDGVVADANPPAEALLSAGSGHDAVGRTLHHLLDRAGLSRELPVPGAPAETLTDDGRHIEIQLHEIGGRSSARIRGHVLVLRDVTDRRRAERAQLEGEAMMRTVLERAPIGIVRLRPERDEAGRVRDFRCVLANDWSRSYLASGGQRLVGRALTDVRPPHTPLLIDTLRRVHVSGTPDEVVLQVDGAGGDRRTWFRLNIVPVADDVTVTFVDISAERTRQLEMATAANQDPLTGLLNRRGLEEDGAVLLRSALDEDRSTGLLFIDLDGFKAVNDTHGHAAGDEVLGRFARRLQDCVRAEDLVGRFGGDEFVVLVQGGDGDRMRDLVDRVLTVGSRPYRMGEDNELVVLPSVGAAMAPEHGRSLDAMVRVADQAMYRAKSRRS